LFYIAIVVGMAAAPFAIHNILTGHPRLGAAILGLTSLFWIDALAIYLKKKPPLPFSLLIVPFVTCVAFSIATHGIYSIFWCSPTIMYCYFAMSRRAAIWSSIALAVFYTGLIYFYVDTTAAFRYIVSAFASIAAINAVIMIINDLQSKLLDQIVTDPLTGAFNRRHMNQTLAEAIERNRRTGAPASVLMIDIDHFKKINDTLGHAAGDAVLKGLVTVITEKSRKLDRLFRIGGEEFLLFLPDTKGSDAMVRAEIVRRMIAAAPLLAKRPVTASIGVSEIANDVGVETWIKRADDALYVAKAGGRDRVVCAQPPALEPHPFADRSSPQLVS
jgi:diguanylate cyclase (GGDEF)-like protein